MHDILTQIEKWFAENKEVALATVIRTWGSAPRPAGSIMAVTAAGEMAGSVSGGCVENATVETALEVLRTGTPQRISFGVTNDEAWSVGLACGGAIDIFVEKLSGKNCPILAFARQEVGERPHFLLTVVAPESPLFGRQGHLAGDSLIEATGNAELDAALQKAIPEFANLKEAGIRSLAGTEIFVQPLLPPPRLVIVGGVHIAIPLARFARHLAFEVILVDPRESFANRERFPEVEQILLQWPDEALRALRPDQNSYVVILSHDPKIDDPALIAALKAKPAYIGVLGSKRTHAKRVQRLLKAGVSQQELDTLHAPIGLALGAKAPEEIALSILAEITAVRRGAA